MSRSPSILDVIHKNNAERIHHIMARPNSGKYLVLVGPKDAPRALLFGSQHNYLAELEHDSLVIDDLIKAGAPCPPPEPLTRSAGVPHPIDAEQAECYQLADW
ncbi:hypothetical protein [Caldimonas brevitalea]|uniref:Uncharacterized protein n=1 Tax=Caldimonas brevitalea TaxID=413882 RepID=A0A0G3BLC4_9BURK|nr:hypothetical protein [Caldimonas brevitalea]AKJ28191.1 hypothetical protein AAW51_1500 [Caldimonas brevitalea]